MIAVEGRTFAGWRMYEGVAALEAIAGAWAALHARAGAATPFQHPGWLVPWARQLATGTPLLLARGDAERLHALVPLHLRRDGVLELAGAPVTDHRDAPVTDSVGPEAVDLLLAAAARELRVSAIELGDLLPASPLRTAATPWGFRSTELAGECCPTVEIRGRRHIGDLVSARLGDDLARFERRLARRGALTVRYAGPDDAERFVDTLAALHAARGQTLRGEPGVLADPRVHALHREAARRLAAAGLYEATMLALDGTPIAIVHAFADAARSYFYSSGFAPSLARFSPATLALAAAVRRALDRGARELHFLRGAEWDQDRWGTESRSTVRRVLVPEAA